MIKITKWGLVFSFIFVYFLSNCLSYSFAQEKESLIKELHVTFVDQEWDGQKIPKSGQCRQCGGKGLSPSLRVGNIPPNTNKILVEFNDRDYGPLSTNGGHGAVWVDPKGKNEVIISSIFEETLDLPEGIFLEHEHRAPIGRKGAYFGPCGCGFGNRYFAVISALYVMPSSKTVLLAQTTIELGAF